MKPLAWVSLPLAVGMAAWALALLAAIPPTLRRFGLVRKNFRGDAIPTAFGLYALLWILPGLAAWTAWTVGKRAPAAYIVVALGYGILGFLDDKWGDRRYSGLKGHFRALWNDRVFTTGLLKAVGGLAVGIAAGFLTQSGVPAALLVGAVIALTANAFNLLDLRPGRATAVFLLTSAIMIAFARADMDGLIVVIVAAFIVYIPDANGRVMLGDTGSNLLGGVLGLALCLTVPSMTGRLTMLVVLVILHLISEKVSITQVIERNPVLRRLDSLTGVR